MKSNSWFQLSVLCACFCLKVSPVNAFYTNSEDGHSIELRGLTRISGTVAEYPEDVFFYRDRKASGLSEEARIIIDGNTGAAWSYEINLQQAYVNKSLLVARTSGSGIERSAAAHFEFSNEDVLEVDVDRLNLRWSDGKYDIRLGRQAVNLATTFYFTPNDFFAPFSAQAFYRVYKPGVDALRLDYSLQELSQLSFITVAGYEKENQSDTGWSDSPDAYRTSYLARGVTVWNNFEWRFLAGRVRDDNILGIGLSGELFEWLGLRAEGHTAKPRDDSANSYTEVSVGIEHRFENSLDLRMEWFYHGRGADKVTDYASLMAQRNTTYLGRQYTAVGASYQINPLLVTSLIWLSNWTDHSDLYSFNAVYSLSDESELVMDVSVPDGEKSQGPAVQSEYGLYPKSVTLEYRQYF